MTVGDGIFGAALVISLVALFIATKGRWNWKKIFLYPLILAGVAGLGFWGWNVYEDRPKFETELWGIILGETTSNVRFKKGTPQEIKDDKKPVIDYWYTPNKETQLLVVFEADKVIAVLLSSESNYTESIQGIYFGSSSERIVEKFGEPSKVVEGKDGLARIYYFAKYQAFFSLEQNKVHAMGIYDRATKRAPITFLEEEEKRSGSDKK